MSVSSLGDLMASGRKERASAETIYQDIVKNLQEMMKDEAKEVRISAAKALGLVGSKQVVPFLQEALEDKEAEVRAAATESLGKIAAMMKRSDLSEPIPSI